MEELSLANNHADSQWGGVHKQNNIIIGNILSGASSLAQPDDDGHQGKGPEVKSLQYKKRDIYSGWLVVFIGR